MCYDKCVISTPYEKETSPQRAASEGDPHMYNAAFYPTPAPVAARMLAMIELPRWDKLRVLEPSAGKGDLADALIASRNRVTLPSGREVQRDTAGMAAAVHCIEPEPDLQAALRGKGYRLVAHDFLTFAPEEPYNLILMNPPFAHGDAHLLHAWEILEDGDVLCLLNAETLRNPCTERRRLLARVIEEHGHVDFFGACFEDAERATSVDVACVHLHKEPKAKVFDIAAEAFAREDPYAAFTEAAKDGHLESEVATRDIAGNLIQDYESCLGKFREISGALRELGVHMRRVYGAAYRAGDKDFAQAAEMLLLRTTADAPRDAYVTFQRQLKKRAWARIFELTDIGNLVSDGVRRTLDKFQEEQQDMAFSAANIGVMLRTLLESRDTILHQSVVEVFDSLTRYHARNRVHVEGWKTNDAWKVNERFVLPNIIEGNGFGFDLCYRNLWLLRDIDRVMAALEGRRLSEVPVPVEHALRDALRQTGQWSGAPLTSTYFELRAYYKGTVHFRFRDRSLWERFNRAAAAGKNWLPDDDKAREKARRAHAARAHATREDQHSLPLSL